MSYMTIRQREEAFDAKFENAGVCFGGVFDCDCACAAAPNYDSTAAASAEAARLSKELGEDQLAETKRQYDLNMAVGKPIIDAQTKLMGQAYDQGNASYNRLVSEGQPIQDQMKTIAMGGDYNAAQKAKQEEAAGTAVADARAGTNQQMQQLIRQGLRYGWSPSKLASMSGSAAVSGAQQQAAAANQARTQTKTQQWGQMGDTYNTYAGLGSQAPAFYNAGTGAGQAANGSQLGYSNSYLNGLNQGNSTIMQGQGLQLQGLGSILNSQTSAYNASLNAQAQSGAGLGSMLGSIAGAAITKWSDARLKEGVVLVGAYDNGLNKYEFSYVGSDKRYTGVIAQEVLERFPNAVEADSEGYLKVNYAALGIEMEEI